MDKQLGNNDFKQVKVENLSLSTQAKRRCRTSTKEAKILEDFYKKNPSPNKEQKEQIANVVQMGERNVHFWFQNRRAKDNKKRKFVEMKQKELVQQKLQQHNQGSFHPWAEAGPSRERRPIKQSQKDAKSKFKLPPIAYLMEQKQKQQTLSPLDLPFYFHHKYFGIEQSCLLEQQFRSSVGKGKSTATKALVTDHY